MWWIRAIARAPHIRNLLCNNFHISTATADRNPRGPVHNNAMEYEDAENAGCMGLRRRP
jgi:hypothetical protein